MRKYILIPLLFIVSLSAYGQHNRFQLGDSVTTPYPYAMPVFGNFLHDIGVDLPYPVGVMANFYYGSQGIDITDIAVGFSGGNLPEVPLTDITRIIDFTNVRTNVTSLNFRPDVWILPFLNFYGIIGKTWSTTTVPVTYPVEFTAVAELDGMSFGYGLTFAGGVNNVFAVVDFNNTWTYMSNFEEPVPANVLSLRLGYTFKFKNRPESNIGIWAGAMRLAMTGITAGSIKLNEVMPPETWARVDEIKADYYDWYNSVDELKQEAADRVLTPIVETLGGGGEGTVLYEIIKAPTDPWNGIIGGQWQIDKHWQMRAEAGVIGDRKSMLLSANYRFGIKRKRLVSK